MWLSRLRTWPCHCGSLSSRCGKGMNPGLGIFLKYTGKKIYIYTFSRKLETMVNYFLKLLQNTTFYPLFFNKTMNKGINRDH